METIDHVVADGQPAAGDLVAATAAEIGQHPRLELSDGRRAVLYEGDSVIVAYGNRYAPDQFEAVVPEDLGPCDLVAAGGVAGRVRSAHADMAGPTRLEPIGLLADAAGHRINLRDWRFPDPGPAVDPPLTVVVSGPR